MNYDAPSVDSRQLARKYLTKVLLKMQQKSEIAIEPPPQSPPPQQQPQTQNPKPSKTTTFVYNNATSIHPHRPLRPQSSRSRPSTAPCRSYARGNTAYRQPSMSTKQVEFQSQTQIHAPLHSGPNCDSVSHYLQHKLEEDQGVGQRSRDIQNADSSHQFKIQQMGDRLAVESARLESLRSTREQLDRRELDVAKQIRAKAANSNRNDAINGNKVYIVNRPRSRSVRSEELTEALNKERQELEQRRAARSLTNRISSAKSGGVVITSSTSGTRRYNRSTISEKLKEERRILMQTKARHRQSGITT